MTTKPSSKLTFKDRLSRLTYVQAVKLLGKEGKQLIQQGGKYPLNPFEHARLVGDLFRLKFPPNLVGGQSVVVSITAMAAVPQRLQYNCTLCERVCEHVGAAFSLILEEKTVLGLAVPPPERTPSESLGEEELVASAIAERAERARTEKMKLRSTNPTKPWTDYIITSASSGKTYRIALRGEERGESYCSCPDFRTNTLGTCKHIMYALHIVKRRFPASRRRRGFQRKNLSVHLHYGPEVSLRLGLPAKIDPEAEPILRPLVNRSIDDLHDLLLRIGGMEKLGLEVTVYPDAEEYIQSRLFQQRMEAHVGQIRKDPAHHVLRTTLLKTELLPYQLDGIAFAVGARRAILADDMGLGKTIQGIGVAELLAREAGISRVLVVCPASLKSQWRNEIYRFCDRDCQLVVGSAESRAMQYASDCFFTVCNYEQVLRDILAIERVRWDLIILDEGQRIKNWEAKTSNVVKSLKSPFALVLSGTPLENRLDDLYSVVQFVDERRLAPAFRFFNRHRIVNENGKILGYKNLAELRERLKPILLRRTRDGVMNQLPERTTEIVRIPPTDEQAELHNTHMQVVWTVTGKKFLSEMDLLRLQKALLMCRMAADSTYLVNKKEPSYSSKLVRLNELLDQLAQEQNRKIVLFSEWTTMLDLIEPLLETNRLDFVRLDGSVPQKKRQELVHRFQTDAECKVFITTNAGSTGLNLQAANTVINVDLPWNPAVLEQRIARAHRMGQKQPVQVFVLLTEETIEEKLLATLSNKYDLALAALDTDSKVDQVDFFSGMDELKQRLEVLLGAKPEAPVDETIRQQREGEVRQYSHRERVAAAGGEMLGAAFRFLGELVSQQSASNDGSDHLATDVRRRLEECVREDEAGRQQLTITLPDRSALDDLARALARLLAIGDGNAQG